MAVSAANRRRFRQLTGTMLVSLGTAVFAGAISMIIDSFVKGGSPRWGYLAGFLVAGMVLSGGGAWLLTTIRVGVGIAIAATDKYGDLDRYQDEAEAFARFGAGVFATKSTLQFPVENAADLPHLRNRLLAGIRTLTQAEPGAASVGLLFQGRLHVGFHVGRWLNVAGRRVDLYADLRDGGGVSHLRAIRLGPAPNAPPRVLDLALYLVHNDTVTGPTTGLTPRELSTALAGVAGTPICLAINLNSPVDDAGIVNPVLASARGEGASAVVIAALPAPAGHPDSPTRAIGPTAEEYESTVSALVTVAKRIPAAPGLLYLKGPAAVSVALGRYLHDTHWIPMQYVKPDDPDDPSTYRRFTSAT